MTSDKFFSILNVMPSQKFKMFAQANFQKKNQNSKFKISLGFTLVELLISVAIMSIIAAIGYVTYGQSQMVARDARRKQDLRSVQTALELYYQSQSTKQYPPTSTWDVLFTTYLTSTYINKKPVDPLNSGTNVYSYTSGSASTYSVCADLENNSDTSRTGSDPTDFCLTQP